MDQQWYIDKKVLIQVITGVSIIEIWVIRQIWVGLEIVIWVNTILGNRYRASTQLRDQRFENCLDDEPQGGPPICQSLLQRVYWEKCQSPELRAFFGFDLGSPTSTFISIFNPLVSSLKFLKTKLAEMGFDHGPYISWSSKIGLIEGRKNMFEKSYKIMMMMMMVPIII